MKHHIIVKFVDSVADRQALFGEIAAHFAPAADIEGIHGVTICPSVTDLPNRYDLMIILDMEKSALPVWAECAVHTEWKRKYSPVIGQKAIFDCD